METLPPSPDPAPSERQPDTLLTEMRQSGLLLALLSAVLAVAVTGERLLATLT